MIFHYQSIYECESEGEKMIYIGLHHDTPGQQCAIQLFDREC